MIKPKMILQQNSSTDKRNRKEAICPGIGSKHCSPFIWKRRFESIKVLRVR